MAEVDTDELLNSAYEARLALEPQRRQIAARRAEIARQLSGTSHRNRGRIAGLTAELANLNADDRDVHQQQQAILHDAEIRTKASFQNAHIATKAGELQQHADVADAVTKVQNGVTELEAKYPNRTFDSSQAAKFMDEMGKLTSENPLYSRNASAAARVSRANEFHQQTLNKEINKAATQLTGLGIHPLNFMNRDRSKDYSTTANKLPQPTGDAVKDKAAEDEFQKTRADAGGFVHFQVGNTRALVKADDFRKWNGLLAPQQTNQAAPATPDQNTGIQPIIPTYGGQGAAPPGGLVRNYDGSISPIIPTYGGEGAAPPGALIRTGVAQIGTPPPTGVPVSQQIVQPNASTATLPPDVQPNAPLVPPTQLATTGPIQDTTQVAAQQPAAQPSSTPQTRNVGGVQYEWSDQNKRWEPQ